MPFIKRRHCSEVRPRPGWTQAARDCDPARVPVHIDTMDETNARCIWYLISENIQNAPGTNDAANALHALARNCGFQPTDGMNDQVRAPPLPEVGISLYQSPGGFIITRKDSVPKFIAFLYSNMDDEPHRVKWEDLTCKKQYEWIAAWHTAGKESYQCNEPATNGLHGTDINARITTVAQLDDAMAVSPSLVDRHPDNHTLTVQEFRSARRRLFMG